MVRHTEWSLVSSAKQVRRLLQHMLSWTRWLNSIGVLRPATSFDRIPCMPATTSKLRNYLAVLRMAAGVNGLTRQCNAAIGHWTMFDHVADLPNYVVHLLPLGAPFSSARTINGSQPQLLSSFVSRIWCSSSRSRKPLFSSENCDRSVHDGTLGCQGDFNRGDVTCADGVYDDPVPDGRLRRTKGQDRRTRHLPCDVFRRRDLLRDVSAPRGSRGQWSKRLVIEMYFAHRKATIRNTLQFTVNAKI